MSHLQKGFFVQNLSDENMNFARHSRQLFPLVLGNSRTALSASARPLATTTPMFSKEELDIKLDQNPYYAKYAEKIKKLKEKNPAEYHKRIDAIKKASENPKAVPRDNSAADEKKEILQSSTTSAPVNPSSNQRQRKGLDTIMKTELLADKLPSEIRELWLSYHKDKDAIFAVIEAETYRKLDELRKANPVFIYPLPRKDGYEMFLGQFAGDDCHFTSLVQYQKHQENAPVQLVVSHYTELMESKGVVLMSGTPADKCISVTDAQLLSYQMQYFYSEEGNYDVVKDFNESPNTFDYNRIIECINSKLLEQQSAIGRS